MRIVKLEEAGYESSALGFSLSYNTSIERAKELMPIYAFGKVPGENKFLRCMHLWFDVDFPRLLWPECDQYKIATVTLSESTIHTLTKNILVLEDFVEGTDQRAVDLINEYIVRYKNKEVSLQTVKSNLPEGFLQRRVWQMNYATLQNIEVQRRDHKIKTWSLFLSEALSQISHPEFVVKDYHAGRKET